MKQHIGRGVFNKEPQKIRQAWEKWIVAHEYPLTPNIGTMIEFLKENIKPSFSIAKSKDCWLLHGIGFSYELEELADALWKVCKSLITKEVK